MKRTLLLLLAAILSLFPACERIETKTETEAASSTPANAGEILAEAFENRISDLQVQGSGTVYRILPDDNKGSRHQRFLLRLGNGQSILIAHNIDLGPRIPELREGDEVAFYGEYEWNEKGGVIHWTHKDPRNRHPHGWLEHKGRRYW